MDQPPYGLLYVAGALSRAGQDVEIFDPDVSKLSVTETIKVIEEKKPDAIGIGGCITGYYYHKPLTLQIKQRFPRMPIVAGGYIGAVPHLLLNKTGVDIVVIGEGENTAIELFDCLERGKAYDDIYGIAVKKHDKIYFTPARKQIFPLDDIPFPPYHLLNMNDYLFDPLQDRCFSEVPEIEEFNGKKKFNIKTARGCTNQCSFCYRLMQGIRQHSVSYTISLIKHLYDNYNVAFFEFDDETTISSKKWIKDFCRVLRGSGIRIKFRIFGARVDQVDEEVIKELKDAGCVGIEYGIESGSQKMLDRMKKRVMVEDNIKALMITKEHGLLTTPSIIVGMPGENEETIKETLAFLKKCNIFPFAVFYATAYPKTELYDYALLNGLIQDEESYIFSLTNAWIFTLNFTSYPDSTVKKWKYFLLNEVENHYLKSHRKYRELVYKTLGLRATIRWIYWKNYYYCNVF
jgi:radical SAM superfamily enzyme YgiQ (UPF0313 family)